MPRDPSDSTIEVTAQLPSPSHAVVALPYALDCQIAKISKQVAQAAQEKDTKKGEHLYDYFETRPASRIGMFASVGT
jgi:hypothetical protein